MQNKSKMQIPVTGIAVDGSTIGNPGPIEWRGVDLQTGRQIFHSGTYERGTNNIAEYLAIVHALAFQKKRGTNFTVYSDSQTARIWVCNGKCRTMFVALPEELRLVIKRAEAWLKDNPIHALVLEWDTLQWGECPADYGRK